MSCLLIENRMATEPALAVEFNRLVDMRRFLGKHRAHDRALLRLPKRIRTSIRLAVGKLRGSSYAAALPISIKAALAAIAGLMFAPAGLELMARGVVDRHIRFLVARAPIDTAWAGSDVVRHGFVSELPAPPRTVDLAEAGFPLTGRRLDLVEQTAVAVLVYLHFGHFISLTAVPRPNDFDTAARCHTLNDFHLETWTHEGVLYWAVSDIEAAELRHFVRLYTSGLFNA